MIATTALFTAFFDCSYGFYVRMTYESVFKAMLTTPIGVREVVIGEFLWVFIRAALMGGIVGLVLAAMGLVPNPWALAAPSRSLPDCCRCPAGRSGCSSAGYVRNINQFQTVYSFLIAPIFYLSGVFFPTAARLDPGGGGEHLAVLSRRAVDADCRLDSWKLSEVALHLAALFASPWCSDFGLPPRPAQADDLAGEQRATGQSADHVAAGLRACRY